MGFNQNQSLQLRNLWADHITPPLQIMCDSYRSADIDCHFQEFLGRALYQRDGANDRWLHVTRFRSDRGAADGPTAVN